METSIDGSGKAHAKLTMAEQYFDMAEKCIDKSSEHEFTNIRAWRGIIARVRGEYDKARDLFQSCIGKYHRLLSVARLYRELALVEHLLGNKKLAHAYEEKGLNLFRQAGAIDALPPHHCYRVIDRMKREGTW